MFAKRIWSGKKINKKIKIKTDADKYGAGEGWC